MTLKRKLILFVVTVLIAIGVVIVVVIIPTMARIKAISRQIYVEREDLETKYQKGQLLKKTLSDFNEIKPDITIVTNAFLISDQELDFVTALEQLEASTGVQQNVDLKTDGAVLSRGFKEIPLRLTVTGTYPNLLAYLRQLERLNYYIYIDSIRFDRQEKTTNPPLVTATISGGVTALTPDLTIPPQL